MLRRRNLPSSRHGAARHLSDFAQFEARYLPIARSIHRLMSLVASGIANCDGIAMTFGSRPDEKMPDGDSFFLGLSTSLRPTPSHEEGASVLSMSSKFVQELQELLEEW